MVMVMVRVLLFVCVVAVVVCCDLRSHRKRSKVGWNAPLILEKLELMAIFYNLLVVETVLQEEEIKKKGKVKMINKKM